MNISLIEQDRYEAQNLLMEYEEEMRRGHDEEMADVLVGLEAQAQGWPVLHLSNAITEGGQKYTNGLPNIAVARADQVQVTIREDRTSWYRRNDRAYEDNHSFWFDSWRGRQDEAPKDYRGLLCVGATVDWGLRVGSWDRWTADVPLIPPHVRRQAGGKTGLRRHLVMWEVEEWRGAGRPNAPADPFLLRPLGGEMYAVIAQWDLTELERAIVAGRKINNRGGLIRSTP